MLAHASASLAGRFSQLQPKFLATSMSLDHVIVCATWNPGKEIRREELGHFSPGAAADVAVFRLEKDASALPTRTARE